MSQHRTGGADATETESGTRSRLSALKRVTVVALAPVLVASALISGQVATPASAATAVPNTAKLAGPLAKQKVVWQTCDFGDPSLNERFNLPNVKCATIKVPRDWHNPRNGLTWDIRISQAKNREVSDPRYKGTLFLNPGGPGGSGLVMSPVVQGWTPDLAPYYNYVGFDPRGVGQSSQVECAYSWDSSSTDPDAEVKAQAAACSTNPDVMSINTEQTAYDMDFIRALLKAPKLSYMGYSYGTWLGAWYQKVFGAKYGDKFLLDSALDATQPTLESSWNLQPLARDRQFRAHMMNWIARHDDTYGLGTDPGAIYQRYLAATANLDSFVVSFSWILTGAYTAFPNNAEYPLAADVVAALIGVGEEGLAESSPAAQVDTALAAMAEKASPANRAIFTEARATAQSLKSLPTVAPQARSTAAEPQLTEGVMNSVFDFVRCNDGQWTQGSAYWAKKNAQIAAKAPLSESWGLLTTPVCAYWKTNNLMPVADPVGYPKTIVVQSELDSQTGWEGGRKLGVTLPNTSFIAVDNEGSHGLFPYGTEAVDRPIITFFLTGKMPKDISVTQAKPLPQETTTYESWAKLNRNAKHVVAENPDPFQPASRVAARSQTTPVTMVDDLAAQQALEQQVKKVYGERGVQKLRETSR